MRVYLLVNEAADRTHEQRDDKADDINYEGNNDDEFLKTQTQLHCNTDPDNLSTLGDGAQTSPSCRFADHVPR